jgi:TonB family protein
MAPLGLFLCAAAWAQSASAPAPGNDAAAAPAVQATPSSTVAPSTGQDTPLSKPPEYKLEPVAVSKIVYPPRAREQKIEGEVVVSMRISGAGDVIIVQVLKGDPLLAHAVEQAAKRWKFKPVISGHKAIAVIAGGLTQIRPQRRQSAGGRRRARDRSSAPTSTGQSI